MPAKQRTAPRPARTRHQARRGNAMPRPAVRYGHAGTTEGIDGRCSASRQLKEAADRSPLIVAANTHTLRIDPSAACPRGGCPPRCALVGGIEAVDVYAEIAFRDPPPAMISAMESPRSAAASSNCSDAGVSCPSAIGCLAVLKKPVCLPLADKEAVCSIPDEKEAAPRTARAGVGAPSLSPGNRRRRCPGGR